MSPPTREKEDAMKILVKIARPTGVTETVASIVRDQVYRTEMARLAAVVQA